MLGSEFRWADKLSMFTGSAGYLVWGHEPIRSVLSLAALDLPANTTMSMLRVVLLVRT